MNTKVFCLAVLFIISQSMISRAQMNMRGWHEFGQTWLVWEDTAPTPETYRIYKASSQITDVSSAEQIGRIFEKEWTGARLKQLEDGLNWTIPDGSGGTYTLESNEALFVYTPHDTTSEYFAVVKDGETVVGSNNKVGPISQTIDPVRCHLQSSGSADGFTYRVYAHWIDGRDDWNSGRFDYFVMGNEHFNGTGHLFRVWEPQGGVTPSLTPAVIALHGGGGWYGGITPGSDNIYDLSLSDAFVICLDDNVLVKKTYGIGYLKTYWLGYWEGYNRFSLSSEQPVPNDGLVVNYTMRRIDWELGWLIENESIDPKRVSLLGGSMGGRGANYQARAHPERYAAWLSLSTGIVPPPDDPFMGSVSQNLATNLPGSPAVLDVMDLHTVLSPNERDIPFGKIVSGRNDPTLAAWSADLIQASENVNATGFGCHIYWDERGHVYSPDSYWADSYRLKAKALTSYRSDQSFPAFFNDDQDSDTPGRQPDMGNGDPSDGDIWGTWSGYYNWEPETIVDSPSQWEATVFLISSSANANDVPSFASSQSDISIRRPQQFTPSAGSTVGWKLTRLSDSQIMQSGQEIVGENSVVTIPNLTIDKDKRRLTVSIISIESIIADVEDLGLNKGNTNALVKKLENAIKSLKKGNNNAAANKINAFINQVNSFISNGKISSEEGELLINAANIIIVRINDGLAKRVVNTPEDFVLKQNYPNPFNPETEINYLLPNESKVSLKIYNLMGQEVKKLVNVYQSAGYYSVKWNGTNNQGMKVASGVYIYIMQAGSFVEVKKLVFLQ